MSEWWRVLMQHCNTATRQRDTSVMKKGIIPCLLGPQQARPNSQSLLTTTKLSALTRFFSQPFSFWAS